MARPQALTVKINEKFITQVLANPEIMNVVKRYAKSESEYSKTRHDDDEAFAHLDVVFTFMFAELKPIVDEHIKLNPGEWFYVDYLQCFGNLLMKYTEHFTLLNILPDELKHLYTNADDDVAD